MPDGKVIQAYEQDYINIPFKDYLADLNLVNGEIIIKNWMKNRKNLTLKVRNLQVVTDQKLELTSDELTSTAIYPAKGDVVELYDSEKLIDRLAL
jgi:hypothetical protein